MHIGEKFTNPSNWQYEWVNWPAPTPLHTTMLHMRIYFSNGKSRLIETKLNGADFLPPVLKGYKQRSKKEVERELTTKFFRWLGAY